MDEMTLLRDFRAERADDDPRARDDARRELEARFGPAPTTTTVAAPKPRRRLLALAGVGAAAAIVAGVLAFGTGPTTPPAAAEVLHQTAAAAAGQIVPETPGPGELLYTKTRNLGTWSWDAGGRFTGLQGRADGPETFTALVTTDVETWTSAAGMERVRETLGPIEFLSDAERAEWEAAGSPLPGKFDPDAEDVHAQMFGFVLEQGGRVVQPSRGVVEIEIAPSHGPRHLVVGPPDPSGLPTEPKALRHAVQSGEYPTGFEIGADGAARPAEQALDAEGTIFGLWTILSTSTITPTSAALRAAAFDALAEMPDIELDRDAADIDGRTGEAIAYRGEGSWLRHEFVFDPTTSQALGERSVLAEPRSRVGKPDLPVGTVISEVAYLRSAIVGSADQEPF